MENTETMENMKSAAQGAGSEKPGEIGGNSRPLRAASGSRPKALPPAHILAQPLEILRGLREIAAFLQISHAEVLDLENSGATIVRRKNIMRAEKSELWEWFKRN